MALLLLALASASAVTFEQVHIATGTTPGDLTFAWSTRSGCTSSSVTVLSCESMTCFVTNSTASIQMYTVGDNIQWISKASAQLAPASTYYYFLNCDNAASQLFEARTVPDSGPTTFSMFGDLSVAVKHGRATLEHLKAQNQIMRISANIHVGDIAYDIYSSNWTHGDDFLNAIQSIASEVPYMVVPGNHESPDNYTCYDAKFNMPNNNFFHSYTIGLVKFVAINTEYFFEYHNQTGIDVMMAYAKQAMYRSAADYAAHPWLIVYGHRPMYCSTIKKKSACDTEAKLLKSYFEDLLYSYRVDLYVNGHIHNYQRTAPVYRSKTNYNFEREILLDYSNPKATLYVTDGGAGPDDGNIKINWDAPKWFATGEEDYSYSVVTALNSTHLWWEQWLSETDFITDSFWIVKDN